MKCNFPLSCAMTIPRKTPPRVHDSAHITITCASSLKQMQSTDCNKTHLVDMRRGKSWHSITLNNRLQPITSKKKSTTNPFLFAPCQNNLVSGRVHSTARKSFYNRRDDDTAHKNMHTHTAGLTDSPFNSAPGDSQKREQTAHIASDRLKHDGGFC